ncbi:hypothetical protein GJ496_002194 [Pomphorhynchus laevis]|nr:hypothetical protein GJ496_002194 [Pomphorhynchus laevis]
MISLATSEKVKLEGICITNIAMSGIKNSNLRFAVIHDLCTDAIREIELQRLHSNKIQRRLFNALLAVRIGPVLLHNFVQESRTHSIVNEVHLIEANLQYVLIMYPNGKESTISVKDFTRSPRLDTFTSSNITAEFETNNDTCHPTETEPIQCIQSDGGYQHPSSQSNDRLDLSNENQFGNQITDNAMTRRVSTSIKHKATHSTIKKFTEECKLH